MKKVSKIKYDNVVRSYWEEFFIILLIAGVSLTISAIGFGMQDMFIATIFGFMVVLCLVFGLISMIRLMQYKKHHSPRDYATENKRRSDRR